MSSTEDLEIFYLKRLLRNTKYLFPATLEEIDPSSIREALLSSKTQAKGVNNNNAFQIEEQSKFESYVPQEINSQLDQVNKHNNKLRGLDGEVYDDPDYIKVLEKVEEVEAQEEAEKEIQALSKAKNLNNKTVAEQKQKTPAKQKK